MRLVVATGVLLVALVGASASSATRAESRSGYASQYVSVMNSITGITASDKGNCIKMASDLKGYEKSHASEIATLESAAKQMSSSEKVSVGMSIESTAVSDISKISQNVLSCAGNSQLKSALAAESALSKP